MYVCIDDWIWVADQNAWWRSDLPGPTRPCGLQMGMHMALPVFAIDTPSLLEVRGRRSSSHVFLEEYVFVLLSRLLPIRLLISETTHLALPRATINT